MLKAKYKICMRLILEIRRVAGETYSVNFKKEQIKGILRLIRALSLK